MAPRANWKGFLKIGELSCPVALYTAASTSERIAFHTVNRATGHRVHRAFVDSDSGKSVEKDDQVKGYEISAGDYVVLEPDEVAAAVPESDKTLSVSAFIGCSDVDDVYFDKPYYLAPPDKHAEEAFGLIREGMRRKKVAAIAQTVLFRRVRTLLIRAYDEGLVATTLNFDYEVRSAEEAFDNVPDMKITGEMLELAEHIIKTKKGKFDPTKFDDRYEAALAELVKAKLEGKKIAVPKQPKREKVVDLMDALRQSAGGGGKPPSTRKPAAKSKPARHAKPKQTAPRRKAG
ncbi:MAG: Ku protein [Mesorhizobium sp.]|uniref:Non-homologous end joining protein Ku n=3 Tax=Mesorhizobium TaxID=68287 RepID=A0AB36R732_9HYPH|nr:MULTISPECIES: Ku protein [Mesorhizobium]RUU47488.1 Ku protein [Mesorhizobium sp. M6A.T.Ca.TU.002.02.2.1]AZO63625.1 Ku protein [Mesorhizobium sp. M6A.T.Cr.TU.016.01.1.1]PAQ00321.1 Ku protein [Mesorhizobium mediterraneum]RUU31577.1 Ku protein [Mesorhizobium sp. M6A.T.Ce.TU.016.01.1.1]RUV02963.1 Ku protein [Mesorhizobium sp. M6A.T.Cr.TU.017.01.1.1]